MADEVAAALEGGSFPVWIDRDQMRPGASFVERIEEGLRGAAYVILLISQASMRSSWVGREWRSTLADQETVLLPVLIADGELPRVLRDIYYIDLTTERASGLRKLVDFFAKEEDRPIPRERGTLRLLAGATRTEIRRVAKRCVDRQTFREFLWDHDMDEGQLPGDSLHERLVSLLHLVDLEGRMKQFLDWLEEERGACVAAQLHRIRERDPRP